MTETATNPTVVEVLRAISRHALLPLVPADHGRTLAGFVGRVEAGITLPPDDERAAARLLQAVRDQLAGPLQHVGLTIPEPPDPVARAQTRSGSETISKLWMLAGGRVGIISPFALKDTIAGLVGARWDKSIVWRDGAGRNHRGAWTIPATPAAVHATLEALAPTGYRARDSVLALADAYEGAQAARAMLADGAPIPTNDGTDVVTMPLWTHQRRGVAYGEVAQAFVAAVKMGGGKTGMAIATANRVQAARVLIVCPNRVRAVWPREVRERSAIAWHIEDGTRAPMVRGAKRQDLQHPERLARMQHVLWDCDCGAPVHAFVLNYEALTQRVWQQWTPPGKLDLIIYDEAHRLKAYQTKVPPRRKKGPAERALDATASAEEILAARREDAIGPAVRALADDATEGERLIAVTKDRMAAKAEEAERANRLTVSGVASRWVGWSHRRIALTGTPFPQHPWDIFGLYRAVDPGVFGQTWTPFRDKYLRMAKKGNFPIKIEPAMMSEFAAKAMELMYRPKVDLQLPGCTDVLREVELEEDARRTYDELDEQLWADLSAWLARERRAAAGPITGDAMGELDDLASELDTGAAGLTARSILTRLLRLQQLTGGTLQTDPVEGPGGRPVPGPKVRVSRAKAEELADVLEEIGCVTDLRDVETGKPAAPEPVIVFCRFRSDLDAVAEVAAAAGLRYQEISGRSSNGLNADARMSEDCDVLGVQIAAGGTGIDLTRARYVVWYSIGYSVSDYDQARARPYRPGQKRPVVMIHLVAKDTKDAAVYAAIKARRDAVAAVLLAGGVDPSEVGFAEEIVPAASHVDGIDSAAVAVPVPWER